MATIPTPIYIRGEMVRISLKLEVTHASLGEDILIRFKDEVEEVGVVDKQPKMEGRSMFMQLTPKK